jgi:hypothetical protein
MERIKHERFNTPGVINPPLDRIRAEPWTFIGLALATGIAAGVLWKFRSFRKALRVYSVVRRLF